MLHLALNIERIYTIPVNRRKFIHLFLIATLCFGQLAASTHIAGHVHDHHSIGDLHISSTDSAAEATLARVLELRRSFAHLAENSDNKEEVDCSIYHAFSSLCGTFTLPGSVAIDWSHLGSTVPTNESRIRHTTSNNQRIRAPPTLS